MIYLDNAATTWPKPQSVINAVVDCMKYHGANPGRGGHKMSISAGEKIYECRELLAEFFGLDNPCNIIFTHNATHALNIVINGILKKGDHIICSQMDHNSLLRPVFALKSDVDISMISATREGLTDVSSIEGLIRENTALVALTHVSNVCGTIQDISKVGEICKKHNIPLLVDCSQSAGIIDINMKERGIDFLCAPGHKALYGPMGTGILCINTEKTPHPFIFGGTGSYSKELDQPDELPDKYESGTLNLPGICGLGAGVRFIKTLGVKNIFKHEMKLTEYFLGELSLIKDFYVLGKADTSGRTGVISFAHENIGSAEVADYLNTSFNIACRAMFHCAYPSHKALGTAEGGTVRVSFGIFNTIGQVKTLLYALEHI